MSLLFDLPAFLGVFSLSATLHVACLLTNNIYVGIYEPETYISLVTDNIKSTDIFTLYYILNISCWVLTIY